MLLSLFVRRLKGEVELGNIKGNKQQRALAVILMEWDSHPTATD